MRAEINLIRKMRCSSICMIADHGTDYSLFISWDQCNGRARPTPHSRDTGCYTGRIAEVFRLKQNKPIKPFRFKKCLGSIAIDLAHYVLSMPPGRDRVSRSHWFIVVNIKRSDFVIQFLKLASYQAIVKDKSSTNFIYYRIIF